MIKTKLLIIGAGPAGLTAAIYAARAGLHPIIAGGDITTDQIPGGALMKTTEIENFPGFPDDITGPELIERMAKQAQKFGATIIYKFATQFDFENRTCLIGTEKYQYEALIIAGGSNARRLNLPDEEKYENQGVSWCATCDGPLPFFRNKPIVVVGGGDSACEEALFLTRFASQVILIHRRNTLRASKILQDQVLHHDKIKIMWETEIVEYIGDDFIEGVNIRDSSENSTILCAGVFQAIGHEPNTKEFVNTKLLLDYAGYIVTSGNVFTNIPGVFAAGDIVDKQYMQAITASGFGCMASIAAERWLEKNKLSEIKID